MRLYVSELILVEMFELNICFADSPSWLGGSECLDYRRASMQSSRLWLRSGYHGQPGIREKIRGEVTYPLDGAWERKSIETIRQFQPYEWQTCEYLALRQHFLIQNGCLELWHRTVGNRHAGLNSLSWIGSWRCKDVGGKAHRRVEIHYFLFTHR